jgi:hypothetical protein
MLLSGEVGSAQNMAGYLLTLENRSIIGSMPEVLIIRKYQMVYNCFSNFFHYPLTILFKPNLFRGPYGMI